MFKLLALRNIFLSLYFKFYSMLITAENNISINRFRKLFPEPPTRVLTVPPGLRLKNEWAKTPRALPLPLVIK